MRTFGNKSLRFMDKTPIIANSSKNRNFYTENTNKSNVEYRGNSTPVTIMLTDNENDDSPLQIASTQEGYDNVDVVWDWNSPKQPKRPKKRLILPQSPKVPMKRHSSNNHIQSFEKLREELQALRDAIALPDNEESLVLSPLEEAEYKDVNSDQSVNAAPPLTQDYCLGVSDDDIFNDSADEDLILCTQKIETDLEAVIKKRTTSQNLINCVPGNENFKKTNKNVRNSNLQLTNGIRSSLEDSFDNVLMNINIEQLETNKLIRKVTDKTSNLNENVNNTYRSFTKMSAENQFTSGRQVGKVEFHRTQSFESTVEYTNATRMAAAPTLDKLRQTKNICNYDNQYIIETVKTIPQHKLDEIERKRKEAIAKLGSKRKLDSGISPSKCSPEEIEQKRLQALAKLEAKRQHEIIERKRQEALKRRELSRKKNATVVKSSLSKRL